MFSFATNIIKLHENLIAASLELFRLPAVLSILKKLKGINMWPPQREPATWKTDENVSLIHAKRVDKTDVFVSTISEGKSELLI